MEFNVVNSTVQTRYIDRELYMEVGLAPKLTDIIQLFTTLKNDLNQLPQTKQEFGRWFACRLVRNDAYKVNWSDVPPALIEETDDALADKVNDYRYAYIHIGDNDKILRWLKEVNRASTPKFADACRLHIIRHLESIQQKEHSLLRSEIDKVKDLIPLFIIQEQNAALARPGPIRRLPFTAPNSRLTVALCVDHHSRHLFLQQLVEKYLTPPKPAPKSVSPRPIICLR